MREFSQLYARLDSASDASARIAAFENYFRSARPEDAAWALWFFVGGRVRRSIDVIRLRQWAAEAAGFSLWMVEECHQAVGDWCETLALLLPPNPQPCPLPLAELVELRWLPLAHGDVETQRDLVSRTWSEMDTLQRLVWHRLITGTLRVGRPRVLLAAALARIAGVQPSVMAHRLLGDWRPTAGDFTRLCSAVCEGDDVARAYCFAEPAGPMGAPAEAGEVSDWLVEWTWPGLRAQLIKRSGRVEIWSGQGEFVTRAFAGIAAAAMTLPEGTVLDGELVGWRGRRALPLAECRERSSRLRNPRDPSGTASPVFMAFDLLELQGMDVRDRPLAERRQALEEIVGKATLAAAGKESAGASAAQGELFGECATPRPVPFAVQISQLLPVNSWDDVSAWNAQAGVLGATGTVLKHRASRYLPDDRGLGWRRLRAGFTLIELLVVIAIIGVLAALLLPALSEAKARAQRIACISQMRQHGFAWAMYLGDHQDRFPDRRDLKVALPEGYRPWTAWPPSDPRAGWAAIVLADLLPTNSVWECPALKGSPTRSQVQARQWTSADTNVAAVSYWMWRFDRTNDPVSLDNFWAKTVGEAVLDLERAANPFLPGPHRPDTVEFVVDVYFPGTAPAVAEEVRGRAAHRGGMNRLYLDNHVEFMRDRRLR
jgi:DNA ligase-1